ncbi:hypothetical protein G6F28_013103 [Rhizopus arrhizus]|nr:hypothetical protein G6F28_013656 [Rhizopus arrhizus]KAG0974380.1 hypothetical protein G6F28_013273 [Rhizopus arrhizus]KAG0974848.1 hypothetical protein G6F28_013103 [Rhizopus arrhizus]
MPKRLPEEKVNDLKQALTGSTSTYDIAKEVGVHESTVSRYSRRLFSNRTMGSAGRPTLVSKVTKRLIKRKVIEGVLKTAKEVHRELVQLGYDISYQSAINVLKSMEFHSSIKKKKPFLTKAHMQHRLEWAKKHQDWTVEEWRKVVFSDETKINVWGSDGCKYYWKRPSDPLQPHHLEFTVKHGGGKLMMWGCITSEGPGYAYQIYDGNMNADVYQHILDTTLRDTMDTRQNPQ